MSVTGNSGARSAPFPYVEASSGIIGQCGTCGRKGVNVTHGPNSRCLDAKDCEAQRARNANAIAETSQRNLPKPVIDEKKRVVASMRRRGALCFFRREYVKKYAEDGKAFLSDESYWELVPERKSATRLTPQEAETIAQLWSEAKFEDA